MATKSIPDQTQIDNLPPHVQQAIIAGRTIEPQVNGRYAAAINLVIAGAVSRNPAGGFDVLSRSTGQLYHINGASCTCKDAEYNAPIIAGRRACAHQVAAWIVAKAEQIARQAVEVTEVTEPAPEPVEADDAGLPLAALLAAAARAQGVPYTLVTTYIGGHGDVAILRAATEDPQARESYLVDGDWRADRLHVCQWGKQFGRPDWQTTATLRQVARGQMEPAVAYYLETVAGGGVKVMVTRGEQFPRPVKVFRGPDAREQATEFARTRAEAQVQGLRNATPSARFDLAHTLMPAGWRQRMGGSQVGRAWVVYAEAVEQPQEMAA